MLFLHTLDERDALHRLEDCLHFSMLKPSS